MKLPTAATVQAVICCVTSGRGRISGSRLGATVRRAVS
jgi:hypothetical protein